MTMIEDELRAAFVARTRTLPAMADPADEAIRRAKAIRRRRGMAATAVAMLLVFTASGGVLRYVLDAGQPAPNAIPAEGGLQDQTVNTMDVRVGQELWTADGRHIALSEVGTVTWIHRVSAGWLYAGDSGVRLLSTNGSSIDLQIEGTDVAVSPDGTRVAWRMADPKVANVTIYAAKLTAEGAVTDRDYTTAPQGVEPIGFAGPRVLLRQAIEAKRYRFDFWPIGHLYTPTWVDKISTLYGGYKSAVIGRVPGPGEDCLAMFDPAPDGLRQIYKKCGLELPESVDGALSPTGRWLAVRTAARLRVLDLERVFADAPPAGAITASGAPASAPPASATPTAKPAPNAVTCKAETATGPPIWIGANIVVATTDKGWAACTTSGKAAAADDPALAQLGGVPVPGNG